MSMGRGRAVCHCVWFCFCVRVCWCERVLWRVNWMHVHAVV